MSEVTNSVETPEKRKRKPRDPNATSITRDMGTIRLAEPQENGTLLLLDGEFASTLAAEQHALSMGEGRTFQVVRVKPPFRTVPREVRTSTKIVRA